MFFVPNLNFYKYFIFLARPRMFSTCSFINNNINIDINNNNNRNRCVVFSGFEVQFHQKEPENKRKLIKIISLKCDFKTPEKFLNV